MQRPSREPFGGILVFCSIALGFVGCEAFSLNGLTGSDGGDGVGVPTPTDVGTDSGLDGGATLHDAGDATARDAGVSEAAYVADAGETSSSTCGPDGGWLLCAGECVDPAIDPANCNGCGNKCSTGLCGSAVSESLVAAPASWTFNGSASYNSFAPSAELTPIGNDLAGTFVYDDPIVVDAFDVQFDFRMGLQGGTRSDGMGFMIEQSGSSALGGMGAGLGMTGLTGYGVELDLYDNAVCGDTNGDHVGVDDLTLCDAAEGTPTSLFASGDLTSTVDLGDAHWHHAEIVLAESALSVSIDGAPVATSIPLPKLVTGADYYFGFAGGTGGLVQADGGVGGYRQEVKNVAFTFPTPRCL